MNTPLLDGIRKIAAFGVPGGQIGPAFQGPTSMLPPSYLKNQIALPGYLKNQGVMKNLGGFGRFLARHPKGAGIAGLAALVGGSMLGSNLIANQKKGQWYNQGHQSATRQLAPMIAARHAPRGAMSLPGYARA